jgi:hypothetical protein
MLEDVRSFCGMRSLSSAACQDSGRWLLQGPACSPNTAVDSLRPRLIPPAICYVLYNKAVTDTASHHRRRNLNVVNIHLVEFYVCSLIYYYI